MGAPVSDLANVVEAAQASYDQIEGVFTVPCDSVDIAPPFTLTIGGIAYDVPAVEVRRKLRRNPSVYH